MFNRGVTANHGAPPEVVSADPTAAKVIGAPVQLMVIFFCIPVVGFDVYTLKTREGVDAVNGPNGVGAGPGAGPVGVPGAVNLRLTGIFNTAFDESVAPMFTLPS